MVLGLSFLFFAVLVHSQDPPPVVVNVNVEIPEPLRVIAEGDYLNTVHNVENVQSVDLVDLVELVKIDFGISIALHHLV